MALLYHQPADLASEPGRSAAIHWHSRSGTRSACPPRRRLMNTSACSGVPRRSLPGTAAGREDAGRAKKGLVTTPTPGMSRFPEVGVAWPKHCWAIPVSPSPSGPRKPKRQNVPGWRWVVA
jgi:hypothetical protein